MYRSLQMNIQRGVLRFWFAVSVIWITVVVIAFHIGVDAQHATDAVPLELAVALVPPGLLRIGFSVVGWIISGFMR
jgi:hypothetical protein